MRLHAVLDGWDISKLNLAESMERAEVLDIGLQDQLRESMAQLKPRPSIYDPDFIAANQVRTYARRWIRSWLVH